MNLLRVSLIFGVLGMGVGDLVGADTKDTKEPSDAVKVLVKKLQSKNPADRIKAANDLEKLGGEAKPALFELVATYTDTNPPVRFAARDALEKVDPKFLGLIKPLVEPKSDDGDQLNANRRRALITQLSRLEGEEARPALPVLFYFATKPGVLTEMAIFTMIAKMAPDDPYVFNGLTYHARTGDGRVRGPAIAALADIKCEPRAILPMLITFAQNTKEPPPVRAAALKTLGVVGLGFTEPEQVAAAARGDRMQDVNQAAQTATQKLKDYREKNGAVSLLKPPAKK